MSLLCDIFVASEQDALIYHEIVVNDEEVIASDRFTIESYSGLTPDSFNNLATIICDTLPNDLKHLAHEDSGEWWLEQFEPEFVAALNRLSSPEIAGIAVKWIDGDTNLWDEDSARKVLADLKRLAKIASDKDRGMYLWGSL